jgi:WD40 repeat protein/serine/threonine protein kinase/tetratricopeptide (TPR) repeat protein
VNELALFTEAVALTDPTERAAFLDRACAGNPDLRRRIDELLSGHARADNPLDRSPVPPAGEGTADIPTDGATAEFGSDGGTGTFNDVPTNRARSHSTELGTVIANRYTLVELLGEGGMGSVYRAEQTEPVKRAVALKLIKSGMDSKAVLARFDAERQALALMDHPNIARVFDGGTTEKGQPFFVMELVQGKALTDYCDQNQLSVKARLELFVSVCQAVQHAHQKGIIHRDLKPGNVLVATIDGKPTPKVIDFGVAKATELKLTEMSFADTGAIVGTPAYMSPEQADPSSMDIDTRTDVYALGVILYELLTGAPPIDAKQFKRGAILEMLRMVREVEPPKPSTKLSAAENLPNVAAARGIEPAQLAKALRGELDWVVMKAIEKDRVRRYETAAAFARDLQRYLADEVVEARPPSRGYRLRKFVRRHKGQVIAASLVLLTLLGGIVGTTLGLIEARAQAQLARDETAEKEKARLAEARRVTERDDALKEEAQRVIERDDALKREFERGQERDSANDKLRHQLGIGNMLLANAAFDTRDVVLAAERLELIPPGQRGWDWRYLKAQTRGGLFTIRGHTNSVTSVSFSPDGTRILSAGRPQNNPVDVKVWDARTGAVQLELKGPEWPAGLAPVGGSVPVTNAVYSPDGTRIVHAGENNTARVCDARTGTLLLELKGGHTTQVFMMMFSPDGTRIVTVGDNKPLSIDHAQGRVVGGGPGEVKVWDARTGKELFELKGYRSATIAAFSPDGKRIVLGGGGAPGIPPEMKVWEAEKGGPALLDLSGAVSGNSTSAYSSPLAFSPDGTRIVVGRMDGTATVIDAQTGKVLIELKDRTLPAQTMLRTARGILCTAFSPDGTRIVTAGGVENTGEATVWDAKTGAPLFDLRGHRGLVMSAAFSPDGARVVTGSTDGTIKLWDARPGTPRIELDWQWGAVNSVAISRDGTRILTAGAADTWGQLGAGKAVVWDARTGAVLRDLKVKGQVRCAAISRDGKQVVTAIWGLNKGSGEAILSLSKGSGEATVWDVDTGIPLAELTDFKDQILTVNFSPDGNFVVAGEGLDHHSPGGTRVFDARSGKLLRDLGEPTPQNGLVFGRNGACVAFSPDGKRIVIGGYMNEQTVGDRVKVVDAGTGKTLLEWAAHAQGVQCVAYSTDGTRIVTGGADGLVRVWDSEKVTPPLPGKYFATPLIEMKGHAGDIHSVCFSPDGARVVSAGADKIVRVWDTRTGTLLAQLHGHAGEVKSVCFSTDGTRIVSGGAATIGTRPMGPGVITGMRGEVFIWDARAEAPSLERKGEQPLKPDAAELEYRLLLTRPNPQRNRVEYLAARASGNKFAADFYLGLVPPAERAPLVAKADLDTVADLTRRADEHLRTGKREQAVPLFVEIVKVQTAALGPDDPDTLQSAARLGVLYWQMLQFDKSVPLFEDLVKRHEAKYGRDHLETLNQVANLGVNYRNAGRLKEAIPLLEEAHRAAKKYRELGWVAGPLRDAYANSGESAKFAALLKEQLAEARTALPKDSPQLAAVLAQGGLLLLDQKQWAAAEAIIREALEIREKSQPDAWTTFNTQSMLGGALLGQKKYTNAEPLLLKGYESMKAREKTIPPQGLVRISEALDRLIELYTATNKPEEVKKYRAERAKYPAEQAPPPREVKLP